MILLFQSSFRLSEKNEKDKKRKELTPVSATPTHMLRICVNPSFNLFLSPRGDRCEQSAPTVRQLLNHGYRFETLKRRLDSLLCHVRLWRTSRLKFWCASGCEHSEIGFITIVPSSHSHYSRPLTLSRRRRPRLLRKSVNSRTFSGRAGNACTNLLGFLV